MPELAEIKIMSDHINNRCSNLKIHKIWKNPVHKSKTDLSEIERIIESGAFIKSEARGKELRIDFFNEHNSISLYFMMGMSGNFKFIENPKDEPKHTHLKFIGNDFELCMYDLRRFARWKIDEDWSSNRGPCPVTEFGEFINFVFSSLDTKAFQKPMLEVLMNQSFFNGIGNYLRAEILGRIDYDPRTPANIYIKENPQVINLCKQVPSEAYILGGGRLKDWYNNEDLLNTGKDFRSWMKFYNNPLNCVPVKDKTGRTFWIERKWLL